MSQYAKNDYLAPVSSSYQTSPKDENHDNWALRNQIYVKPSETAPSEDANPYFIGGCI